MSVNGMSLGVKEGKVGGTKGDWGGEAENKKGHGKPSDTAVLSLSKLLLYSAAKPTTVSAFPGL